MPPSAGGPPSAGAPPPTSSTPELATDAAPPVFQGNAARTMNECACQSGEGAACARAANLYADDVEAQGPYNQHGCALGDPDACFAMARLLQGDERARGFAQAEEGFRLRCLAGDADGCGIAIQILQAGWARGYATGTITSLQEAESRASLVRCEAGDASACSRRSVRGGDDAPALAARAAELFEEQCRAGDGDACVLGAMAYYQGRGIPEDRPRGIALWEFGLEADDVRCEGGDLESCIRARNGWRASIGRPQPRRANRAARRAIQIPQQACDQGDADACAGLAQGAAPELGDVGDPARGVRASLRADALLVEQCEAGQARACSTLGERCITANFEYLPGEEGDGPRDYRCALIAHTCPHDVSEREAARLPRCNPDAMWERNCAATRAFVERACELAAAHFRDCNEPT